MTTQKFSRGEALRFGWSTMKSNFWFFVGFLILWGLLFWGPTALVVAISMIISMIAPGIAMMFAMMAIGFSPIFYIVHWTLIIVISMGLVKITLRFYDKEKGKISDLFSQYRLFLDYLLAFIFYGLILLGPLLLLSIFFGIFEIMGIDIGFIDNILFIMVIPIIIISAIKFWFFDYFVVDKKATPIKALKGSSMITKGVKWNLFVFFLVIIGINIVGMLPALVGYLLVYTEVLSPIFMIATPFLLIGLLITIPTTMVATAFVYRKLLAQTETVEASEILPEQIDR